MTDDTGRQTDLQVVGVVGRVSLAVGGHAEYGQMIFDLVQMSEIVIVPDLLGIQSQS